MMEYVKHKLSLKTKSLSKRKLKDPMLSSTVTDDSALVAEDPSPADQPALQDTPVPDPMTMLLRICKELDQR